MNGIEISNEELLAQMRSMFPREFEIAALTVANRKQTDYIHHLENVVPEGVDHTFWDKSTERRVPLGVEKG